MVLLCITFFGISLEAFTAGVVAIGMNFGAYGAEIVRGGILAVPKGQWEGAFALNFTPAKRMRKYNYTSNISNNITTCCKLNSRTFKSHSACRSCNCC